MASDFENEDQYYQDLINQIQLSLDIDNKKWSLPKISKFTVTNFNVEWKSLIEGDTDDSKNNRFIAKWLLHKNNKIKEHVLRTLLITMKHPLNKSKIIKYFLDILLQRDWQKPIYLMKLLQATTHILHHVKHLFILDQDDIQKQYDQISQCLSWQNKADAIGLVLLCHYDIRIRVQALAFLNEIKEIYEAYIDKLPFIQQNNAINVHKATIGRLLSKMSLYDVILECVSSIYVAGSFSQTLSKLITSFVGIIETIIIDREGKNIENGTRLSMLSKYIVNAQLHETISYTVDTILHLLSFMPYSRDKTGWSTKKEWTGFAFVRFHWIGLHSLLFSVIGAGLSNPFNVSSENDSNAFKLERKNLQNELFKEIENKYRKYLYEFWGCLHEEALWISKALNSILQQTNWESMSIVLNTLHHEASTAYPTRRRRGKNIISEVAFCLKILAQIDHFPAALYIGGDQMVQLCFKFVNDIKTNAFRADRIEKRRWWDVQTNLIQFYAYFLRSLSNVGAHKELRREFWIFPIYSQDKTDKLLSETRSKWLHKKIHNSYTPFSNDPMPHIKLKTDRFLAFYWLLNYLADVEQHITPFIDPRDVKEHTERKKEVRFSVFMALQYLLNTGCIIPTDKLKEKFNGYIIALLRGSKGIDPDFANYSLAANSKNKSILSLFVEAEMEGFELLTPLLAFQFESLIAFYIDQAQTHPTTQHLFRKAIVDVIKQNEPYNEEDWRIIRWRGPGFLGSIFHYVHKLLFLGFIMITENSTNMQYNGYLLLKSIAEILVGDTLVDKLEKLKCRKFITNHAVLISEYFATSYPMIASLFFRVCVMNIDQDPDDAEWILSVLKPWTAIIHLSPMDLTESNATYAFIQNKQRLDGEDVEFHQTPKKQIIPQLSNHDTFTILARLLDVTSALKKAESGKLNEKYDWEIVVGYVRNERINNFSQDLLKLIVMFYSFKLIHLVEGNWMELSHAFPYDNLFVVLWFISAKHEEVKKTWSLDDTFVLKDILYAIMEGFYVKLLQDQQKHVCLSILLKTVSYSLDACKTLMYLDKNSDLKFFQLGKRISSLCLKLTYHDEEEIKQLALECLNKTKAIQLT